MKSDQRITISVIGGHDIDAKVERYAHEVGVIVAKVGAILVCGGLNGTMEAAARGCKEAGGTTIGLLPGTSKADANPYIDIALPTTIGFARNAMVACSADIIVALPGSHGTSCEISYGLIYGRPVIDLGNWNREGMIRAKDLQEAEIKIKELVAQIQQKKIGKKPGKLSHETADQD